MIPEIETRLVSWIRSVLGDDKLKVWLGTPGKQSDAATIGLYLYELGEPNKGRGTADQSVGALFRYLVTAWDGDPGRANERIGELFMAALDAPEAIALPGTEIDIDSGQPYALWQSLGMPARPSFVICVHAFRDRERRVAPVTRLVRKELVVDMVPTMSLAGQVVVPAAKNGGRDKEPPAGLAAAYVEIPHINRTTRTDATGRFRFTAIPWPGKDRPLTVRVSARGRLQEFSIGSEQSLEEPVILPFPITEP